MGSKIGRLVIQNAKLREQSGWQLFKKLIAKEIKMPQSKDKKNSVSTLFKFNVIRMEFQAKETTILHHAANFQQQHSNY